MLRAVLKAFLLIMGDILYIIVGFFSICAESLHNFVALQSRTARRAAHRYFLSGSFKQMMQAIMEGRHGILSSFLHLTVPAVCCIILCAAVHCGTTQQFGVAVAIDGQPVGMVANEAAYAQAEELVRKRLEGSDYETGLCFKRSFQVESLNGDETILSPEQLADQLFQRSKVDRKEGYGVYIGSELQGIVDNPHAIEAALRRQLSAFCNRMNGEAEDVHYADNVTYEAGIYPTDQFVSAQALANQLTEVTTETRVYTTGADETIYAVAERFSVTPDELRRRNSGLTELIPPGTRVNVPVEIHRLPILYSKRTTLLSFTDYETVETESSEYRLGERVVTQQGVKGEKRSILRQTFTDGILTATQTLFSVDVEAPVTEEIAVGTYNAQPYSTATVIDGSGKYFWPVNGGKLTCFFGGESKHIGLDIGAAEYSEIYAADGGVVQYAGWDEGYGNFVILQHEDGFQTVYAHCVELCVKKDDTVKRGDKIALVGSTGDSNGAHLHFEVRDHGTVVNPAMYLSVNVNTANKQNNPAVP